MVKNQNRNNDKYKKYGKTQSYTPNLTNYYYKFITKLATNALIIESRDIDPLVISNSH